MRYHGSENVGVTVIKFPGGGRQPPPEPPEVQLGEAIETAVEVHDLIVEGLRCQSFVDSPVARRRSRRMYSRNCATTSILAAMPMNRRIEGRG